MDGSCGVLVVTGLKREARIVGGSVRVVIGGGNAARLAENLERHLEQRPAGLLSIGIAGGLQPGLLPGTPIVGSAVVVEGRRFAAAADWAENLRRAIPHAHTGDVTGCDEMVVDAAAKTALLRRTGALTVDMETHVVARQAASLGIPFAVLRIVADPAERSLPVAAQVGLTPEGGMDGLRVLSALLAAPRDIPALLRTARDAGQAFAVLARCSRLVGPGFCFPDLRHPLLDMA